MMNLISDKNILIMCRTWQSSRNWLYSRSPRLGAPVFLLLFHPLGAGVILLYSPRTPSPTSVTLLVLLQKMCLADHHASCFMLWTLQQSDLLWWICFVHKGINCRLHPSWMQRQAKASEAGTLVKGQDSTGLVEWRVRIKVEGKWKSELQNDPLCRHMWLKHIMDSNSNIWKNKFCFLPSKIT